MRAGDREAIRVIMQARKQKETGAGGGGEEDEDEEEDEAEPAMWSQLVRELVSIPWLPVHTTPLLPHLPWRAPNPGQPTPAVAPPSRTRAKDDAWACSYSLSISRVSVTSDALRRAFLRTFAV